MNYPSLNPKVRREQALMEDLDRWVRTSDGQDWFEAWFREEDISGLAADLEVTQKQLHAAFRREEKRQRLEG